MAMRSTEQIDKIKQRIQNPFCVKNFLNDNDIQYLISMFEFNNNKIHKNTGPVTLNIKEYLSDPIIKKILDKLSSHIESFELISIFFFKTDFPHVIHNDDTFDLKDDVYKGITLPLKMENFTETYPKLCFFDQFYFHGPSKFFNGSADIPTYYNKQVYEYSNVDNKSDNVFEDKDNLFTHLKSQWLKGLSLHSTLDWIPGDALIFDSVRLHCASDFRNLGIKSKLGISIFTKKC
jgi:hypothetical protein